MSHRIVFDTNVFVSAYGFGSKPGTLMRGAILGEFTLLTSPALLAELARVLSGKLAFDDPHVEGVVKQIARVGVIVRPGTRLDVLADDPDNRVLECAVEGRADAIVSGDRHLLALGEHAGIRIMGAAEALEWLIDALACRGE